ncbi:hypothetical protein N3T10_004937 [Escherichia coli]|uniref:hypothetical protein n=1 Tax=Escherichia coli TaxID=562 RepID=UPI0018272590|nr:hypothetical protein [Escherichia coli]EFH3309048.1 hypothetical protein [Escherichia coli]EFH5123370.1 hypothetical protein [Escherichia coli]EIY8589950.1 hypothetical protein [Escherichia coli]EJJ0959461.1 hypothetical protein [Escherichia coli]EJT7589912.1 hypothetical protein [Escherichia coli]
MLTAIKNIVCESSGKINIANDTASIKNKITTIHTNKKIRAIFFKSIADTEYGTKNTQAFLYYFNI